MLLVEKIVIMGGVVSSVGFVIAGMFYLLFHIYMREMPNNYNKK